MMMRLVLLAGILAACSSTRPAPVEPTEAPPTTPAPSEPAEARMGDGSEIILPGPITFNMQTGDITADSMPALESLAAFLTKRDYITVLRIEGHVALGVEEDVMVSGALAYEVGKYLLGKGIACQRLLAAAFGSSKPIADNSTAEGRALNNRITLVVAELRGKAIAGMPIDGSSAVSTNLCSE